jgi:hypothetical protein
VAGYSNRSLPEKLGVKADARVALVNAPQGFESLLGPLPDGARVGRRVTRGADLAVMFTTSRAELTRRWVALTTSVGPHGAVWVAWPKRASGVATDVTEDVVREVVLPTGWVDTKVCAIDDTWSGLRCVMRKALRPGS